MFLSGCGPLTGVCVFCSGWFVYILSYIRLSIITLGGCVQIIFHCVGTIPHSLAFKMKKKMEFMLQTPA